MKQYDSPVAAADALYRSYRTRDPDRLARELDITVYEVDFKHQKGAYKYYARNAYIFLRRDLDPVMRSIVLFHEIGHHVMHRREAVQRGGFREFTIFDMQSSRMEYEANVFAAQMMLPDDEVLEYIEGGYDSAAIARAMHSDINLVALKVAELNTRGFRFQALVSQNRFLK